ncbi:hypothetical protein GCM10009547_06170 [Sporichthya brevicatena]|uniref:DUF4190 domain-containing protein n=1 Tax=Sporichthya brevicatena TaxID=171442 RepID=A0ABP3RBK3_9ACTN
MYERGSNSWNDSYGSGAWNSGGSTSGGDTRLNGSANGSEHVWYRSPSGDATPPAPAYTPQHTAPIPTPAYPLASTGYDSYTAAPAPAPAPAGYGTTYDSTYEATTYESAYAPPSTPAYAPPATQTFPATPAPGVADVTAYDPVTGLPLTETGALYPMRNVAGRMAMILGVVAILFTSVLFPLFPLAFLFAIGAIVLGRKGRLRARYGFASNPGSAGGGFALGVIALVLATIWTAAAAWLFTAYSATDFKNCVQDTHTVAEGMHCMADVVAAG